MSIVSIQKLESYEQTLVDAAVARHMDALDIAQDLKPGMRVLLKPNLLTGRRPERCVTTHPSIIRAVANWLRAQGIEHITLADSPGGPYQPQMIHGIYKTCGLDALSDVLTLNEDFSSREVKAAPGCSQSGFTIISPVLDADYIINLAKMKTHGMTTVSLGVKNLFGCVPGLLKPRLHYANPGYDGFVNMLVSLCETVRPNLTLIDAVDGMEGNGPSGGTVRHVGLLLASRDIYQQDYVATRIMGVDPDRVDMIRAMLRRGLLDPEHIEVVGEALAPVDPPFQLPDTKKRTDFTGHLPRLLRDPISSLMDAFVTPVPVVIESKCVGCGKCQESCPQQIIDIVDKKAVIRRRKCISCFCCQEMCPAKAIEVEQKFRARLGR